MSPGVWIIPAFLTPVFDTRANRGLESEKGISSGHPVRVGPIQDRNAGLLASSKHSGYTQQAFLGNLKKVPGGLGKASGGRGLIPSPGGKWASGNATPWILPYLRPPHSSSSASGGPSSGTDQVPLSPPRSDRSLRGRKECFLLHSVPEQLPAFVHILLSWAQGLHFGDSPRAPSSGLSQWPSQGARWKVKCSSCRHQRHQTMAREEL